MTTSQEIVVLHAVASVAEHGGGPSRSVPELANALANLGTSVGLASRDFPARFRDRFNRIHEFYQLPKIDGIRRLGQSVAKKILAEAISNQGATLIHDHGIWLPENAAVISSARKTGIPYVISPRGMLMPHALGISATKKKLALAIYQRRLLMGAAMFFSTSHTELQDLRSLGLRQPIALVPNGVSGPVSQTSELSASGRTVRTALFLSRIHPIKGLLDLVRAWGRIRPINWRLVVAGPDEGGHLNAVNSAIKELGLSGDIVIHGPVDDEGKWELFSSADLFVLPTYSENFGIAIAEAMAAGLPVITTTGAPWGILSSINAGWWVEPGEQSVGAALQQAIATDAQTLRDMGKRGKCYVEAELSWNRVARDTLAAYEWLLHRGPQPAHVHT